MAEPQAAQEPQDPRPVIWTVGASFDRRADMLWKNEPCRDVGEVMRLVRAALTDRATEITIRDRTFHPPWANAAAPMPSQENDNG